jgi:hypothetical protein
MQSYKRIEILAEVRRKGELRGNQVQHILFGLGMGQVGIQKMLTEGSCRILQILHAESANGLHDVGAHATQWRFLVFTKGRLHLRCSFFIRSKNFWLTAKPQDACFGSGKQGAWLPTAPAGAGGQHFGHHSTILRKLA